ERLRERDRVLARLAADDVDAYPDARRLQATDAELLAAIARLGRRRGIAVGVRDVRRSWTVATGDPVLVSLAVSPDGTRVATGGRRGGGPDPPPAPRPAPPPAAAP